MSAIPQPQQALGLQLLSSCTNLSLTGSHHSVCFISVYRMLTLRKAVDSTDPSWENIGTAIWSIIELDTAIICASLPTLRPLVAKWMPHSGFSSARDNSKTYSATPVIHRSGFREAAGGPWPISTEELALKDMGASLPESMPTVYTHATADIDARQSVRHDGHDGYPNRIVVTTEHTMEFNR